MKPLGDFQRYLIEEYVEDWREGQMDRRDMIRRTAFITGGVASAATVLASMGCAGPAPTATTAPKPTAAPPPPTAAAPPTAVPPTAAPAKPTEPPKTADPTKPAAAAAATTAPTAAASATKPAAEPTKPAGAGTAAPAAAAQPPARSPLTVAENDPVIEAKKVEFKGEAGTLFGYFAKPKAAGTYPGMIVIHENRGLLPHIEDVVRRAAKEGFVALGVDLLSRAGGTARLTDPAQVSAALGNAKPEEFVADLSAGIAFIQQDPSIKKEKIGVMGFCFGGGYSYRLAVGNPQVLSATPFYGPAPPAEQVPNTKAAILGIYAGNDERINASIPGLEDALKKAGKTYEIKTYPGVNHAFHNDTGANWNEAAAVDAWKTVIAWHKKHLA